MTPIQKNKVFEALDRLNEARVLLDEAMYGEQPRMSDEEFARIREFYEKICRAQDVL